MPNLKNRNPLTNWPGKTDSGINPTGGAGWTRNPNFRLIRDFIDKEGNPDPILYFMMANDLLTLQDSVFSLQETLGIDPSTTSASGFTTLTVDTRLDNLESGAVFNALFDTRYGGLPATATYGSTWTSVYDGRPSDRSRLTILGHVHDGIYNSKISLSSQVTGTLPKANLDLTSLTGDDIKVSSGTTEKISTALGHCLKDNVTSLQVVQGSFQIRKDFNTNMFHEYGVAEDLVSGQSATADNTSWTGYLYSASTTTPNAAFYRKTMDLRYWRYSIGLRSKVSNITGTGEVATLKIYDAATSSLIKSFSIAPNLYRSTNYEVVYTDFVFNGTRPSSQIQVEISWTGQGKNVTWKADSISILPIHLAAYNTDTGTIRNPDYIKVPPISYIN